MYQIDKRIKDLKDMSHTQMNNEVKYFHTKKMMFLVFTSHFW